MNLSSVSPSPRNRNYIIGFIGLVRPTRPADKHIALGLEDRIGSLEVGKKADIVFVDLKKPHLAPLHNVISHLVYSAVGSDVDTTIVDGKILMRKHKILTLNEDVVLEEAQKTSDDLLGRGRTEK